MGSASLSPWLCFQLAWAVRSVTPVQAKYIKMFYGEAALAAMVRRKAEEAEVAEVAEAAAAAQVKRPA